MGSYRLTRLLGRGGFAEVYLGEHILVAQRQAAIKVLSANYTDAELQRFCDEVSTIFHLVHPKIVRVLDFGVEGRVPFLVMDYAPSGTLRQRHPAGKQVALEVVLSYVEHIAEALRYAHEEQVIHRDIKPENLLIGRQQEVLLSDFGIAIKAHRNVSRTPQEISGTACYMAPEQCQGDACQESDQYSLAVVVYEWLSGEPPFQGDNPFNLVLQHMQTPPPPLRSRVPALSPKIEQVVMKALAKDPQNRFPHIGAFAAALKEASQEPRLVNVFPQSPPAPFPLSGPLPAAPSLPPDPPPDPLPSPPLPLARGVNPLRLRREQPREERDVFPLFVGGCVLVLIGIFALVLGNGHPSIINWTIALCGFGIGGGICIAAFLFS
jgi:serine/threonine protein kinase